MDSVGGNGTLRETRNRASSLAPLNIVLVVKI
jgi:hypothetical protein